MYFELTIDPFFDYGISPADYPPWDITFVGGSVITEEIDDPFVFRTNAERAEQLPDFWSAGYPAMSKRFVELLEGAGVDNLQKFPAVVESEVNGTVWDDYLLVNILDVIECADLERSTYTEIFPGGYSFDTLAIHAEKADGTLLFRLEESASTILIHKRVGTHIGDMDPDRELQGWEAKEVIQ